MKLTKKLFIAIMTMALLVITFGTSTFAWFTLGQEVEIEKVNVNVTAGAGMEISADAKSWKNSLRLDDSLSNAIDYIALSTYTDLNGDHSGVKLYNDKGTEITFNKNLGANEVNYFFEKTFYLRITKTGNAADYTGVYLTAVTGTDKSFSSNDDRWLADATFSGIEEGTYQEFDPINAVKISFEANEKGVANLIYGYENDKSKGTPTTNGMAKAYADAKDYSLYAIEKDHAVEDDPTTENVDETAAATYYTLPTYRGLSDLQTTSGETTTINHTDNNKVLTVSTEFVEGDAFKTAYSDDAEFTFTGTLDTNYVYAKVTVRVWIDGWDADCINAILDGETSISFKLEAYKAN